MTSTSESPTAGLVVHQPVHGFRYSAEAFWLVGFAIEGGLPENAVDLGTGSGIMAGLLAAQGVVVDALDVREEWEPYWQKTQSDSKLNGALRFHCVDVVDGWDDRVDLVLSNPPFFKASEGPGSPNLWKRAARTESTATLKDFICVGANCLRPGGRLCMVLPSVREREANRYADEYRLSLARTVKIGKKRVLLEWIAERVANPTCRTVDEQDDTIQHWYALATREQSPD